MDDTTQKLVDGLREALAAERAAAYAQLDSEDFEECIEATDSALAALEAAQSPLVEHPAHSGHEFGGAYARAAALAAGDPDWMNATGGQRPPVSPEQREALEWAGIKALVESPEVPTGVRALLLGEVVTIREAVDAEPVVRVILDALLARFSLPWEVHHR